MKHLDLFSGIGGFALAAKWVWGKEHEVVSFCEIDPFCQKVLKKHWPDTPICTDIRSFNGKEHKGTVDIITGGFPCQDISVAGSQRGITGLRSGLWSTMCDIINDIRPRYAIMENSPNLLKGQRGAWFRTVLSDLAEVGYNAIWHCIPAAYTGAPHHRDRVWIIAYPNLLHNTKGYRLEQGQRKQPQVEHKRILSCFGKLNQTRVQDEPESRMVRVVHGISQRLDKNRLHGLGNAIVPQVAAVIMQAIKEESI